MKVPSRTGNPMEGKGDAHQVNSWIMKENGLMMFRKGRAKKLGLMELNILDNIKMA